MNLCRIRKNVSLLIFNLMFFYNISNNLTAQNVDAYWTLVIAGKNIPQPVFWNGNIYTAGEDRALTCITSKGKFLWRRNSQELPGKFLSVSNSGLVYLVTVKGNIEVFSSQGFPVWNYKLDASPIFPVHTARDGRCFIIQSNRIICLAANGKLKWSLPLTATPIAPPSETGSKDIVLIFQTGDFLRISIFGEVVEQHHLKKNVTAIGEAPGGYVLACSDGSISYYKTAGGSGAVWEFTASGICKNIFYKNSKILYLLENGKIIFKTLETNEELWQEQLNTSFSTVSHIYANRNEFNITANGFGAAVTDAGKIKWQKQITEKSFLPIITENGLLVGVTKEFLNAYRVETKLLRHGQKKVEKENFYSIIEKEVEDSSQNSMPFFIEYSTTGELLDLIEEEIKTGAVGEKEPRYAMQLKTILQNKRKASYFAQEFMPLDRARAAELLGKLGSYEYRSILLGEVKYADDSSVNAGILRGLANLAYDSDGKTINAIEFLIQKSSSFDDETMKAACDCLFALVKSGNNNTTQSAIRLLFLIRSGKYSSHIKNYAVQKIQEISKK